LKERNNTYINQRLDYNDIFVDENGIMYIGNRMEVKLMGISLSGALGFTESFLSLRIY